MGFEGQINNAGELITRKKKITEANVIHLKYVDDLALAEAVHMKKQVGHVPRDTRPQPNDYRARTGHEFDVSTSEVSRELNKTNLYAKENGMKLNFAKTKLILFNPCTSRDFMPNIAIDDIRIDLVEQVKLLGVVVTSDLSWAANTKYIVYRCNSKRWTIRRLKKLGTSRDDLIEVYTKQIRSISEFAVPVWNSSLTGDEIISIERIQKSALHIILDEDYNSYNSALKTVGPTKLSQRRRKICLNFAKKCQKNPTS